MSSNQGLVPKAAVVPAKPDIDPRREKRIHIAIPVKVFADAASPDFQTCCTYEISTIGVRLVAPTGIREVGQVIILQRQTRRARYKVIWIGKPGTAEAGQVGVETLEPGNSIWENEIRMRLLKAE